MKTMAKLFAGVMVVWLSMVIFQPGVVSARSVDPFVRQVHTLLDHAMNAAEYFDNVKLGFALLR